MATEAQNQANESTGKVHGAAGTLTGDRGDAKAQPSGYQGTNPATAGTGETKTRSATPENASNQIDPSAPGETGTTPGSNAK